MALQVSGSTVVNDSLQLQNIASLDATTTATIGAAAGGGVWELNSSTTISSTVSSVSNIVIPSSGSMCMVTLEGMNYGLSSTYFNAMLRMSTNGGSSYYSTSGDYKRYDGTNRDGLVYRESTRANTSGYTSYSAILLQGLPAGEKLFASWMWGMQFKQGTTNQSKEYFESTAYYRGYWFDATTDRPDRFQVTANFSNAFTGGTIRVYEYSAG
jgi:hypothetical protein